MSTTTDYDFIINKVATTICDEYFPVGTKAKLKRMDLQAEPPAVFYEFAIKYLNNYKWEEYIEQWKAIIAGLAIMAPNSHTKQRSFGEALVEAEYSNVRFEKLIATPGDMLPASSLRIARGLRTKKISFNWVDVTKLLFANDFDEREVINRKISKDYYYAYYK